ncbi:MAG: hypothetical protein DI570_12635 [Phenylobacterium zucineum]|nr:MAG: hypothetical protein DI570_12635 [Phenylobacterium zucineum]
MKRTAVSALALLTLTACQPQAPDGKTAPPPADAPAASAAAPPTGASMDFSKPVTALGTEPFWSVVIDGTALTLKRPDAPDKVFTAPGAVIQPGRATWVAKAEDGAQLTLTLYGGECGDGMSDRRYPWTAEVAVLDQALRGCAIPSAQIGASPAP